jgi:hypothetical protein
MLWDVVALLLALFLYGCLPAGIIWGWVRWTRNGNQHTLSSILSLAGLAFATISALLAIGSTVYAHAIGGFPFYDPLLLRIYRWGSLLSLAGIACGTCGVWRPNPLRWLGPGCAFGMLIFWFAMAEGE